MPAIRSRTRLKKKMQLLLIGAGLEGMSQTTIISKCRTHNTKSNPQGFTGDDVRAILKGWQDRELVQVFHVRKGYAKKYSRIWRAVESIKTAVL